MADADDLLERSGQLGELEAALEAVLRDSAGRLVLISGEAGAGKTALLRRFRHGQGDATRVLWGACEALLTPEPLGPLSDIAEATGGELAALVSGDARPHEVAGALMRELKRRSPSVLVIEDVHWADEATLDVMKLLGRRLEQVQGLLLVSYRDDVLDRRHPLRVMLGDLGAGPRVKRLAVPPLSESSVRTLAERYAVDGADLFSKTNGNPFFITEVLAADAERIPDTVRDAVLARAARLSASARELIDAVAVAPAEIKVWLLEQLVGEAMASLEECLSSGMLRASTDGVRFRHELARLAVEETLTPDRRHDLHRRALAALADSPRADASLLAHHAEAAGDADATLRFAPEAAARAAALGAHREAAAHYGRALRFAERMPVDDKADLFERRAHECYLASVFDEALEAQERALACYRELGDRLREGDALRTLGRLYGFAGRTEDAGAACREAIAVLEPLEPGRELALAYAALAQRCLNWEDVESAVSWGTRALELAERLDDTEIVAYALTTVGAAEFRRGDPEGMRKLERSLDLAQRAGLEDHAGRAYVGLVAAAVRHRSFPLAERHLQAGLEYCDERGLDYWRLFLLACGARCDLDRGRWSDAADTAAVIARDPRAWPMPRIYALTVLGLVRARRGDPDAVSALDEALAYAEPTGELQQMAPVVAAKAEAAWLEGRPDVVEETTAAMIELARQRGAVWEAGEFAAWRKRCGITDDTIDVAEPYAAELAGEHERAAELWTELGCPYEAALALAGADGEDALRGALAAFQELGATPGGAIVARRLRERGVRGVPRGPRAATRQNPAGLTARELDVLKLIARGLRNAQIAERLFLSEKTVDHHVSAILRKLEVGNRGEASAEAVRLGVADEPR